MGKKNKIAKFNRILRKYQSKRDFVQINRTVTEGEANLFGIIHSMSEDFMQLAETDEFKFNGEIIIPMNHFDSIECNKYDKFYKHIMEQENELSKSIPKPTKLDLSSWETIFTYFKKEDIHVIIECEDLHKPTFNIGPIEKVTKKSVGIRNYNALGHLEKKLTRIKYKHITLVKFKDHYSCTFRKYLKKHKCL